MARIIYACVAGSHLYGTALPDSDTDVKAVYVPNAEEFILGRDSELSLDGHGDDEVEFFDLRQFMKLLLEGQTVALDMMFAWTEHMLYTTREWEGVARNRHRFLCKKNTAFIAYCRQQATRYCVKAERMNAIQDVMHSLALYDPNIRLGKCQGKWGFLGKHGEHVFMEKVEQPDGKFIEHLNVCGRQLPLTVKVGYALDLYKKILGKYRIRVGAGGIKDEKAWKALMHAVRVAEEAKELLSTGKITFPRPNADKLLMIRKGEIPYETVIAIIDATVREVEELEKTSALSDEPAHGLADRIILDIYRKEIGK